MKKNIAISLFVIVIAAIAIICSLLMFDNATDDVVSKDKTKVLLLIDENYKGNTINAKISIDNQNDFDINMFGVYCTDNSIHFDIPTESAFTIDKNSEFSYEFTITFDKKINSDDFLSLLKSKDISVNFNANSANQNDIVTSIQPELERWTKTG